MSAPEDKLEHLHERLDELRQTDRLAGLVMLVKATLHAMMASLSPTEGFVMMLACASVMENGSYRTIFDDVEPGTVSLERQQAFDSWVCDVAELADVIAQMALGEVPEGVRVEGDRIIFGDNAVGFEIIRHNAPGSTEVN